MTDRQRQRKVLGQVYRRKLAREPEKLITVMKRTVSHAREWRREQDREDALMALANAAGKRARRRLRNLHNAAIYLYRP